MIFNVKKQGLKHKARLVVSGHVVDSTEHTTYSSTIKYVSVRLMLLIDVNNGLGIMAVDIGNTLYTAPRDQNNWSCCGAEFGPRCGAVVVLKRALYGLNTASNSFHNYFGYVLRDLVFSPSRADQDLCTIKSYDYEGNNYLVTHMDDVIIDAKNTSKYMHKIAMYFRVRDITDSTKYYLGNELVQVGNHIHFSSNKYVNEILCKYQKTHGEPKKYILPMRDNEHPELDDSPFLNEK